MEKKLEDERKQAAKKSPTKAKKDGILEEEIKVRSLIIKKMKEDTKKTEALLADKTKELDALKVGKAHA